MADQQVIDYLRSALAHGRTKEELYQELLTQGWTLDIIQESFKSLDSADHQVDTQKRTVGIIVTIATVLVGAGIFSFIAANWDYMGRPVKVLIILAAMIISYALGWYFKEQRQMTKTGEALLLLGSIIYGAGIFLVAQMFHIRAHWPDGFILWMLGTLVMAFAVQSYPLFYLGIPLALIALVGHPFELSFIFGSHDPFLLTSSLLLAVATVVTFAMAWTIRKKIPQNTDLY